MKGPVTAAVALNIRVPLSTQRRGERLQKLLGCEPLRRRLPTRRLEAPTHG